MHEPLKVARFRRMRILTFILLCLGCFIHAEQNLRIEERALILSGSVTEVLDVAVYAKGSSNAVFGRFRSPVFVPSTPFVRGRTYEVEITRAGGSRSKVEVTFDLADQKVPVVYLSPAASRIPANTLKLYLDFSEPMEQGDFLKHLKLRRREGGEVAGAFRETELWSPDGKRLTVMLHPGRQKTGVNLNLDEGPVLVAGESYDLVVSSRWRSAKGVPLGSEGVFLLQPVDADHDQPDPSSWQVILPRAKTREALVVKTDELFEPQIFMRAIIMNETPGKAQVKLVGHKGLEWRFTPEEPWKTGGHEITLDPELEDLAGNTTQRPFEIDLSAQKPLPRANVIRFHLPDR